MQAEVKFCDSDLTGKMVDLFNILFTDTEPNTSWRRKKKKKKRCKNVEHMQSLWNGDKKKKLANNNNHSTDHLNSNVDDGNWEQKEQRLTKHWDKL